MSFNAIFYQFAKRDNSTARPSEGTTFTIVLKEPCSVINPEISLIYSDNTKSPVNFNYCHIAEFNRYYFVTNWTYRDRKWYASLKVDVLASWKDYIGSSTLYVLRSSAEYDANIIDSFYPAKCGTEFLANAATINNWSTAPDFSGGTFVLGVVNSSQSDNGGVTYYLMSSAQISQLRAYMLGEIKSWDNITDFSGDIAKAFIDPFQYVVSCMWIPLPIIGGEEVNIKFGFWDSTVLASPLVSSAGNYSGDIAIPKPDRTLRGKWELLYPFADYYVVCYPWGIIPIDGNSLVNANSLHYEIEIDYITGISILKLSVNVSGTTITDQTLLESVSAQVGVQIQLAQITTDYTGLTSGGGIVQSLVGATVGAVTSGIMGKDSGQIASAAQAALSHVAISGTTGGKAGVVFGGRCVLVGKFLTPVAEEMEMKGRPLCQLKQISTLGGYIEVQEGDISAPSTIDELVSIKNYLEGGFYYE